MVQASSTICAVVEDFTAAEHLLVEGGRSTPRYHIFVELALDNKDEKCQSTDSDVVARRSLSVSEQEEFDKALRRASAVYESYRERGSIAQAQVHQVCKMIMIEWLHRKKWSISHLEQIVR